MVLSPEEKQRRKEQRRKDKWNREHKDIKGIDHKLCSECKEWKPSDSDNFYKNKANSIDGLHLCCKKCAVKKSISWNINNPEKVRKYARESVKRPDRLPYVKEQKRRYIERGKRAEWERNNREKLRQYSEHKRLNGTHIISSEEWIHCKKYFDNACAYCGISEELHKEKHNQNLHKEHVQHDGLNDLSNCVPACKACNSSKRDYRLEEWYNNDKKFYAEWKLNKIIKWIQDDHKNFMVSKTNGE
jgi:HNH endonuclease